MPEIKTKRNLEFITRGKVTAAYFSTSGYVENKNWKPMELTNDKRSEPITKEDSGIFVDSSDEAESLSQTSSDNQTYVETTNYQSEKLTEIRLKQGQLKKEMVIHKCEDKLSVISEKSCETGSQRTITSVQSTRTIFITETIEKPVNLHHTPQTLNKQMKIKSSETDKNDKLKSDFKKKKKKRLRRPKSPNKNINLDIPQVYERQNTADLLNGRENQVPVARASVNRKISTIRNNMYSNHLRESTKKLQDDLRQTMRKYSTEKTQLLKHLSSLRHEMEENQIRGSSTASTISELSSERSNKSHSRYFMAPNLAAHKIGKKKKKTQTQETKITSVSETAKKSMEGILKLPSIHTHDLPKDFYPKTPPKNIEWDSGRNNSIHNLPPLDPPPGIAAAQDLLHESFKIPKILDPTRNDITHVSARRTTKKKVHFAEKHSISEFLRHKDLTNLSGDAKSLPPISRTDIYSVDSIKAFSALPPILGKDNDLDQAEVVRATQQYKSMYLKMKDPEQRMKTLAEILYSVRLRMIENEHTIKYGINPKHMKQSNTLCDFLMNRNHNSSMSMNSLTSDISTDMRGKQGIPHNTAARSGRKSTSLQNYLRKMSRSRRPSEEIRLSRMMAQPDLIERQEQSSPQTVTY